MRLRKQPRRTLLAAARGVRQMEAIEGGRTRGQPALKDMCLPSSAQRDRKTKEALRAHRHRAESVRGWRVEAGSRAMRGARRPRGPYGPEDDKAHAGGDERKPFSRLRQTARRTPSTQGAEGHRRKWWSLSGKH